MLVVAGTQGQRRKFVQPMLFREDQVNIKIRQMNILFCTTVQYIIGWLIADHSMEFWLGILCWFLIHPNASTFQTFQSITDKCSSSDDHHASSSASKLSDDKLKDMTLTELEDMIMYTSDICFTLQRFLVDVYPPACHYFLEVGLCAFYLSREIDS